MITSLELCHVQPPLTSNLGFVSLMILNLSHLPGFALDTGKKIQYVSISNTINIREYQNFNNLTQVFSESEERKNSPLSPKAHNILDNLQLRRLECQT